MDNMDGLQGKNFNIVANFLCEYFVLLGTKVVAFINGVVPCNKRLLELINIVKPIVREVVESVNKVGRFFGILWDRLKDPWLNG